MPNQEKERIIANTSKVVTSSSICPLQDCQNNRISNFINVVSKSFCEHVSAAQVTVEKYWNARRECGDKVASFKFNCYFIMKYCASSECLISLLCMWLFLLAQFFLVCSFEVIF